MKKQSVILIVCFVLLISVVGGCALFEAVVDDVLILSATFDPDFDDNGIIKLKLIPVDVDDNLASIQEIQAEAGYTGATEALDVDLDDKVTHFSLQSWAMGIDIDSSGSMSSNDPDRLRVSAAKTFVSNILNLKSNSLFNIYDFGAGSTTGFDDTRQLTDDWTSDEIDIEYAIDEVIASGGTPMYESILEVLEVFDEEISSLWYQRAMLVLSDGLPNSDAYKQDVFDSAVEKGIPVNTISLGSGDYENTMSELAEETGGIYTNAADAETLTAAFENISLGTSQGYYIYDLTFRDPDVITSGTTITLALTITAKEFSKEYEIVLNR